MYIYGKNKIKVNDVTSVPSINTENLSRETQASDSLICSDGHSPVI